MLIVRRRRRRARLPARQRRRLVAERRQRRRRRRRAVGRRRDAHRRPRSTRSGDGTENPDAVGNAVDGDPTTAWSTEQYDNFPDGAKTGVGLALDLDGEYDVQKVIVDTQQDGWSASIYVSDKPVGSSRRSADWGEPTVDGADLERIAHLRRPAAVKGRSVLRLAHAAARRATNGKHYVDVTEVRVA